jgi:hypothetical protein
MTMSSMTTPQGSPADRADTKTQGVIWFFPAFEIEKEVRPPA